MPTLEIAKGSDYCNHLLGLELTCNHLLGLELTFSECSATMSTSGSSVDTEAGTTSTSGTSVFEYTPQVLDYRSLLVQPGTRLLADIDDYDDPLWILECAEDAAEWNEWKVAYNRAAVGDDYRWVVRRTVWWWGEYTDMYYEYTNWFLMGMRMRSESEVEPAFQVWN